MTNSNATLTSNSFIKNNSTKGGAVAFLCDLGTLCNAVLENNTFVENSALEGSAIHYNLFRPDIKDTNTFDRNEATYGYVVSSFPSYLEMPSEDHLNDIASGQRIANSLLFRVLDYDGQVILSDNSSILIIQSIESGSSVTGETQRVAVRGELSFTDLEFVA